MLRTLYLVYSDFFFGQLSYIVMIDGWKTGVDRKCQVNWVTLIKVLDSRFKKGMTMDQKTKMEGLSIILPSK